MRKLAVVLLALVVPFSSNAYAISVSQTKTACAVIARWPDDFATGWPIAIKKHNANPNTVSAASYMNRLTEVYKSVFKLTDKNALILLNVYESYWTALEQDYVHNNGHLPSKPSSSKILNSLQKYCAKYPS